MNEGHQKKKCKTVVKVEKLKEVVLCKISIKESNSCAEVMTRTNVLLLITSYENQRDEYVEAKISIKAKEYTNKCQRRCTVLSLQVHLLAKIIERRLSFWCTKFSTGSSK